MKSFVLKDAPLELIEATQVEPKGRKYDKNFATKPSGIRIDEVLFGMKMACAAITDDEPGTLKQVRKLMPWHIEALTVITGSEEEAHKPISHILSTHFNLKLDKFIDISGWAGRFPLDTQGFVAHNDKVIVLSYRCTTTIKDWMTNFTTTSSEWEPEIDIPQGHSGHFSCMSGLCCGDGTYKPRVHTGFYNNFLATAASVQEHIDPLLAPGQPPRKLYVVGHSLGAGIATMAACYFLLEHDWAKLPHKLVCVTAGSPRSVLNSMRETIQEKLNALRPLDKAVVCRVVRDKDVVPTMPPAAFGFVHLDKLVYITKPGDILINPALDDDHIVTEKEMQKLNLIVDDGTVDDNSDESVGAVSSDEDEKAPNKSKKRSQENTAYERKIKRIPRAFRDHMPDFYLKPLMKLFEAEQQVRAGTEAKILSQTVAIEKEAKVAKEAKEPMTIVKRRRFRRFGRGKKTGSVQIKGHREAATVENEII